jgi:hypothetical protein
MPVGVVKNAEDEKHWGEAKAQAQKEGHEGDWAYVMGIYQRMKHHTGSKAVKKSEEPIVIGMNFFIKGNY